MFDQQKLKFASILYKKAFPLYRLMYFNFKNKKDRFNIQVIKKIIRPGFNVLDIGANIGFYGNFFSEHVGVSGHVYCFEPDATNFKHLKNQLKEKSNVSLIQKAVASTPGTLTLYTSDLLNVDHRTYEPENYTGKYTVEKISIDAFVNNRFKVDFIKMDIQGFEMDALKGMEQTLASNPGIIILTEFWPYGLQQAGTSATVMYDYVTQLGFKIFKVDKHSVVNLSRDEVARMQVEYFTDEDVILSRNNIFG